MRKLYFAVRLALKFCRELILSNIAVAKVVLRPKLSIRPGIIAYQTKLRSDFGITTLANLITLTPGTLTMDVSDDRTYLYIHTLNISHPEEVAASIRNAFEKEILELEK